MALTATIYNFDIHLSDVDRNVYETLSLRVAQQPSETEEYLVTRVLAYCLEYTDGIAFTKGLAEPDTPAITVRDLTGALRGWIEIGSPDADRLHKASKASPRVAVYTHKDPERAPAIARRAADSSRRIARDLHDRSSAARRARGAARSADGVRSRRHGATPLRDHQR